LVQAVGLAELGSPGGRHALDLLEAPVDGVPLLLHLGSVKGAAGHQAVCLAVQVFQAILGEEADGRDQKTGSPMNGCLKMRTQEFLLGAGCWWLTPVILATQEAEIRKITI
jgi:hypothetical protein